MNDSSQSTLAERIDEICDRFEHDWKTGRRPRVEDYLDGVVGSERDKLQSELLRVDEHYRRRDAGAHKVASTHVARSTILPLVAGFELLSELGCGGMGIVYLARQLRPNRLVALKMISAGVHAGVRELERFRSETDAVAKLQHANIVQVYEVGDQDRRPYFAMEYVAGGSLDRFLAGAPQQPLAAARLIECLALAIHHAHQRGIIHRDLKPANVLLQHIDLKSPVGNPQNDSVPQSTVGNLQSAIPKITDFGLAKLIDAVNEHPTQSGDHLGTPSYMAPEQVGGRTAPITAATDVYGLGAILYELLTGRPPFRGDTVLETMQQVQSIEPVSPSRLQPKCPRDLVTICLKCLNKQPHQRYASALDLADDLRRFQDAKPIRAKPISPIQKLFKWTQRQPLVASLAGLLLLAVVAGIATGSWFWWRAEEGLKTAENALGKERAAQTARVETLDRYQVALAHREWLANNVGRAVQLLESCTDEQRQSWEWRYLNRMRHSPLQTLAGHRNIVQAVAIHPSGKRFASASHDCSVRVWNRDTGRDTILGQYQTPVLAVAYSPDGRWLASSNANDSIVKMWDGDTGAEKNNLVFDASTEGGIWTFAFDATSRYLAVGGLRRVKVWDMEAGQWAFNHIAHPNGAVSKVIFSPDGRYLATSLSAIKVWEWTGNPEKPKYEWRGHPAGTYDLSFSPDGNLLASGGRDGLIRVHSMRTGQEEFTLNAHQLAVTSVCFSPLSGDRLASAGHEGDMHVWNIKERRRLLTLHGHSGAVWDLNYSPDGTQLVSAGHDNMVRVWDAIAGQEAVSLPIEISDEVSAIAYSSDGRLLAWGDIRGRTGVWDTQQHRTVFRHDDPQRRGTNRVVSLVFNHDGRQLAWRQSNGVIRCRNLESGEDISLTVADNSRHMGLAFSTDGSQLRTVYVKDQNVIQWDLMTGQKLLSLPKPSRRVSQVIFNNSASQFVTLEDRKILRLWDSATGQPVTELEHAAALTCIIFSNNGRQLAVGDVFGDVRIWDLATQREIMNVAAHSSRIYGLDFSPDGRRLASTGSDCTMKLWDATIGHEVLTLRTQLHEHSPLAFSPDGADLVSVNMDNRIQIWTTRVGRQSP